MNYTETDLLTWFRSLAVGNTVIVCEADKSELVTLTETDANASGTYIVSCTWRGYRMDFECLGLDNGYAVLMDHARDEMGNLLYLNSDDEAPSFCYILPADIDKEAFFKLRLAKNTLESNLGEAIARMDANEVASLTAYFKEANSSC